MSIFMHSIQRLLHHAKSSVIKYNLIRRKNGGIEKWTIKELYPMALEAVKW